MRIGLDARLIQETGVGRYIRALVQKLPNLSSQHEWILFLSSNADISQLNGWKCIRTDIPWHTFSEQIYLPRLFSQAKLDLVHIPYFSVPIFMPVPFIVTIHDLTISHFATGKATTLPLPFYLIKRMGYNLVMRQALSHAKKVITVSQTVAHDIQETFNIAPLKLHMIYEAGELEYANSNINRAPATKPYILYIGNAHPHKNLDVLMFAFENISRQFPDLELIFIGKIDYFYNRLKNFVLQRNFTSRIHFIGNVANQDLGNWYTHARAFIFPSISEGFGIPGLEAMQMKCPVVASDIPVFHEIYGNCALFFEPTSVKSLEVKLITILTNEQIRSALIEKGILHARTYSWQKMVEDTLKVYESI